MMVHESFYMVGSVVDMICVGRLGATSIAGVGVASIVFMLVLSVKMGLIMGVRAIVARLVGAGDDRSANHVAMQAFVISAVYGVVMTAIGVLFAEPLLNLFGLEPDVVAEGAVYMRIMFIGWVTMSFWISAYGIIQASGDTVTAMKISIFVRSIHVVLDPFLIFGWWIFPRLGVGGAALTNVVSQGLGLALGLWVLFSGRSRLQLTLRNFRLDPNIIWRMVKIGIPASITGMERTSANLVLVWFVVPFGTVAVAAHSLLQRIDTFLHMPSFGLGLASGVLAGQNLGAGQPERAEKTGWQAAGLATGVMLVGSVVIWFWAEYAVRIFNTEPALVEIAGTFLRIEIVSYLVFGFVIVLSQCLNGVGDTMIPMLVTLLSMWGIQVPLAYFLPKVPNLGVYGVRWAIVTAMVGRAVIYTTYFKLGRWKRKRV